MFRVDPGMRMTDQATQKVTELTPGTYQVFSANPDLQAILWVLNGLQDRATASTHILFNYEALISRLFEVS